MARVLVLTTSMGEGHNTAARNIRDALIAEGNEDVLLTDPYTRTNQVINKLAQKGYNTAINSYPKAWKVIFELLSKKGVVEGMSPMFLELTTAMNDLIEEYRPDVIVSTYPVFAFLLGKIRKKTPEANVPYFTVITDSTQINSAWFRWPSEGWIVADQQTADVLTHEGIDPAKVHIFGFPVSKSFDALQPAPEPDGEGWKVILFPGGRLSHTIETLAALGEIQNLSVTVITGRRRSIFRSLQDAGLPRRGDLVGWTDEMPKLMSTHHIFVGKAGGATVQEAIAAQIPFLVSHVVPGQEEGNISLIEQTGIGALAVGTPQRLVGLVRGMQANGGAIWKACRANLAALAKPSASRQIARYVLSQAKAR